MTPTMTPTRRPLRPVAANDRASCRNAHPAAVNRVAARAPNRALRDDRHGGGPGVADQPVEPRHDVEPPHDDAPRAVEQRSDVDRRVGPRDRRVFANLHANGDRRRNGDRRNCGPTSR